MHWRKVLLLVGSMLVFPLTFLLFQLIPVTWSFPVIYISAMSVYWFLLLCVLSIISQFKPIPYILSLIALRPSQSSALKWLAFLPVVGVFFIAFLPNIGLISVSAFLLVICLAVVNGTLEEVFWRGAYVKEFPENWIIGFGLSTVLFGAWHISLWFLPGVHYHGGFAALVGGAFFMGLLWSYIARKLHCIRFGMYAHVLVNIFAFTGLFVENL